MLSFLYWSKEIVDGSFSKKIYVIVNACIKDDGEMVY